MNGPMTNYKLTPSMEAFSYVKNEYCIKHCVCWYHCKDQDTCSSTKEMFNKKLALERADKTSPRWYGDAVSIEEVKMTKTRTMGQAVTAKQKEADRILRNKAARFAKRYENKGDVRMAVFWSRVHDAMQWRIDDPANTDTRRRAEAMTCPRYRILEGSIEILPQVEMRKSFSKLYLIKLAFLKFLKYTINIK